MADPDDLDALVTELNAAVPQARSSDEQTVRLRSWLEQVVERSASDLLLVKRELVDRKDALTRAGHPEELERLLDG